MPRWEYRVEWLEARSDDDIFVQRYLDALGEKGWELTAVVPSEVNASCMRCFFKRPLAEK